MVRLDYPDIEARIRQLQREFDRIDEDQLKKRLLTALGTGDSKKAADLLERVTLEEGNILHFDDPPVDIELAPDLPGMIHDRRMHEWKGLETTRHRKEINDYWRHEAKLWKESFPAVGQPKTYPEFLVKTAIEVILKLAQKRTRQDLYEHTLLHWSHPELWQDLYWGTFQDHYCAVLREAKDGTLKVKWGGKVTEAVRTFDDLEGHLKNLQEKAGALRERYTHDRELLHAFVKGDYEKALKIWNGLEAIRGYTPEICNWGLVLACETGNGTLYLTVLGETKKLEQGKQTEIKKPVLLSGLRRLVQKGYVSGIMVEAPVGMSNTRVDEAMGMYFDLVAAKVAEPVLERNLTPSELDDLVVCATKETATTLSTIYPDGLEVVVHYKHGEKYIPSKRSVLILP